MAGTKQWLGTRPWHKPNVTPSLTLRTPLPFLVTAMWPPRRGATKRGTGACLRDYRAGATRSVNATRLSAGLSRRRDEIGERDEVVFVVAGAAVVGPTAGDQP